MYVLHTYVIYQFYKQILCKKKIEKKHQNINSSSH